MPEIDIETSSPVLRKRDGLKPIPTPAGVPVAMGSPGPWLIPPRDNRLARSPPMSRDD
jgi:hypothetical protein